MLRIKELILILLRIGIRNLVFPLGCHFLVSMDTTVWYILGYNCLVFSGIQLSGISMDTAVWYIPDTTDLYIYGLHCLVYKWIQLSGISMDTTVWYIHGYNCLVYSWT